MRECLVHRVMWSSSSVPKHTVSFPLAQTGEGIAECEVVQWYVNVGDTVRRFGRLCEVQSDKAAVEITSPYDGVLSRVVHPAGEIARVGEPLCEIQVEGELPAGAVAVNTNSTTTTTTTSNADDDGPPGGAHEHNAASHGEQGKQRSLCSPAVRRLAREKGVKLEEIHGSGPKGRVLKADVIEYVERIEETMKAGSQARATPTMGGSAPQAGERTDPAVSAGGDGHERGSGHVPGDVAMMKKKNAGLELRMMLEERDEDLVLPLRGYDRAMARAMTAAASVPHLLYCDDVRMDALHAARETLRASPSEILRGAKLTYLPLLLKALSLALLDFPRVNASFGADGSSVVIKRHHNIGVAMATPNGLVVPNIKAVDRLSVADVAVELRRLQALAAANKLDRADLEGGTITVSNIGSFGGTYAAPLLNVPEAAIVAIGKVRRVPGFDAEGRVVPQAVMGVSWSADHRVVDGETVARLCGAWKDMIENPSLIMLRTR